MGVLEEQRKLKAARKAAEEKGRLKDWAARPPADPKPAPKKAAGIELSSANKAVLVSAVNQAGRKLGGLAELPEVRRLIGHLGSRQEIDAFLQAAERSGWIDLKTANDPKLIPNRDDSIKRTSKDGFGERTNHLYYAVVR